MNRERAVRLNGRRTLLGRVLVLIAAFLPLALSSEAFGQKGMGDAEGVVRQGLRPASVTLSGGVVSVDTHPCEKTTGPAPAGTHLIVAGIDGVEYNVHMGPADLVAPIAKRLGVGEQVEIVAFRTAKLPENQYVAITILAKADAAFFRLRDANLKPFWSHRGQLYDGGGRRGGRGRGNWRAQAQWRMGGGGRNMRRGAFR